MLRASSTRTKKREPELRGTATQRGYTKRWTRAAAVYRAENPVCVICEEAGRVTPSECVDHVRPHKGDEDLFWDERNWQALCHSCHSVKTRSEQGVRYGDQ